MSLPPLDFTLPTDHLHVTVWSDPVVDLLGHDLRSAYVERFWLPVLGPTTTFLLRRIAADLEDHPDGYDLPLLDTATALGLGVKGGRNAPFLRAISRSIKFKVAQSTGPGVLAVRTRIAPLNRSQLTRLPAPVRDEHEAWQRQAERAPDLEQQKRRARRLALSLAELGESDEDIEHHLHRWKLHPALAHEALRWARERQRGVGVAASPPAVTDTTSSVSVTAAAGPGVELHDGQIRRIPPRPSTGPARPPRPGGLHRPSIGAVFTPEGDAA